MSRGEANTITRPESKPRPVSIPPLNPGDRLSRAEFERRYEVHPEIKKAELVEGVVYMPSPLHFAVHSEPHGWIITWLGVYAAATPGARLGDNATVRLDLENEVQPDALLRLEPTLGGRSSINADDYVEGAPELIVEIAASSAAYDLHDKRRVYQRSGVQEYIALQMYEQRLDWFVLRDGVYQALVADKTGILRSEVFPGLALKPETLFSGELADLLAVLQQELASSEHSAFVAKLKAAQKE